MNKNNTSKQPSGVQSNLWIAGSKANSFDLWKMQNSSSTKGKEGFLMRKYANIWMERCGKLKVQSTNDDDNISLIGGWLKKLIFSPSSRQTRSLICSVLDHLAQV